MEFRTALETIEPVNHPTVFLAGGITGCEDWQMEIINFLRQNANGTNGTILNPRRKSFPIHDPNASRDQIMWEHAALWGSDVVSFWFAGGASVQPIVMFEFGMHLGRFCAGIGPRRLVVGVDPDYRRRLDVQHQLDAHNQNLSDHWKVRISSHTVQGHAENILSALS